MQPAKDGWMLARFHIAMVPAMVSWCSPTVPPEPVVNGFISPESQERIAAPWTQVHLELTDFVEDTTVRMTLNGKPWKDPMAQIRRRTEGKGGGHILIAELETGVLPVGTHELTATYASERGPLERVSRRKFEVVRPGRKVHLRVVDGQGAPTDARIFVQAGRKAHVFGRLNARVDPPGRDRLIRYQFAVNGELTLWLPENVYTIRAVRGVREEIATVTTPEQGNADLTLTVPTAIATPGWLAADLHVHTVRSLDAMVPHRSRMASLAAAGLEAVVISDHHRAWDAAPLYEALGAASPMLIVPGTEANIHGSGRSDSIGHLNVFPMLDATGTKMDVESRLGANIKRLRRLHTSPGPQILQLNHPRGIQFRPESEPTTGSHALFSRLNFQPETPVGSHTNAWMTPGVMSFDAIEVVNRFSWVFYRQTRKDWYALWNQGYRLTGTGNSDSHSLHVELAGLPSNLVHVGVYPDLEPEQAFLQAIKDGRLTVSTGPIIDLQVLSVAGVGRPGDQVTGKKVTVRAVIRAPSWVPVPEARLVVNGEVRETAPLSSEGEIRGELLWNVRMPKDGYITVEAGYPLDELAPDVGEVYAQVAPGYVPLAFTNPVRVDADGNGQWVPPGLF